MWKDVVCAISVIFKGCILNLVNKDKKHISNIILTSPGCI